MRRGLAIALVVLASATASASPPPSSCRELDAPRLAKLPQAIQAKISEGATWEIGHELQFPKLDVTIVIARGPQLVREILLACPGAIDVFDINAIDARRFTSNLHMHVKSFATIARIIQMPSVQFVSIFDPTIPRPMIPEPMRNFR